jgi:hypothetical protein
MKDEPSSNTAGSSLLTPAWLLKWYLRVIPGYIPGGLQLAGGRLRFIGTLIGNEGVFFDAAVDEIERVHWRPLGWLRVTIAGKGYTLFFTRPKYAPDVNLAKIGTGESPAGYLGELSGDVVDRVMGGGPDLFDLVGAFREDIRGRKAAKRWRSILPETRSLRPH